LNRASVGLFALERPAGAQYFPSPIEFVAAIGVLAIAAIVYAVGAQYLPVFSETAVGESR